MKYLFIFIASIVFSPMNAQRGLYVADPNGGIIPPPSEKRVALVVGNAKYQYVQPLVNPENDAADISASFRKLGFDVLTVTNGTRAELIRQTQSFISKIQGQNTVALFYYSGHGLQVGGDNWLVPIEANPQNEVDVEAYCFSVNYVMGHLEAANAGTNIIILDACRNNPFRYPSINKGSLSRGLAQLTKTPAGSFIAFSTAPNTTALDGSERNSPYTQALIKALEYPNIPIELTFKIVRQELQPMGQVPWENSSLVGDFYFRPESTATNIPTIKPSLSPVKPAAVTLHREVLLEAAPSKYKMGDVFGETDGEELVRSGSIATFIISKYETTFAEYDKYCESTGKVKPNDMGWGRDNRPITNISFYDAIDYANWRSRDEGLTLAYSDDGVKINWDLTANGYRLPTEEEWEYAASWDKDRQIKTRFGNGKDIADSRDMNYAANTKWAMKEHKNYKYSLQGDDRNMTLPVGSFNPNSNGLYDMAGNVLEYCWAFYVDSDGKYSSVGTNMVIIRGGSYGYYPKGCRVSHRTMKVFNPIPMGYPYLGTGFRLVRSLK